MATLKPLLSSDPTLDAADVALIAAESAKERRQYLGASSIGGECSRKLWYGIQPNIPRKPTDVESIKRFHDGFAVEDVVIERLRAVPGVELWTRDEKGEQIGGTLLDGKFGWHVDGIILGLLQAPKTPHVLEVKATNDTKFNKFVKLRAELGEKTALRAWDSTYYYQAQVYCELLDIDRHYTVVCTPGARQWASCRTERNTAAGKSMIMKAQEIIEAAEAPAKISETPDYWLCRFCEFSEVCHGG